MLGAGFQLDADGACAPGDGKSLDQGSGKQRW